MCENEILRRRREMMAKKTGLTLLFGAYNETVVAGQSINTGIMLFDTNKSWTILIDITITSAPPSGNGSAYKLIMVWDSVSAHNTLVFGKNQAGVNQYHFFWMGNDMTPSNMSSSVARKRVLVTHEANSDTVNLYYKSGNGLLYNATNTYTFVATTGKTLFGSSVAKSGLPGGTIEKAEIWNYDFSADEISAFFE